MLKNVLGLGHAKIYKGNIESPKEGGTTSFIYPLNY